MTIHPTFRGCAIGLLALVGVIVVPAYFYQEKLAAVVATLGAAQVEAIGPNWAAVHHSRELAKMVPALADELARAKKAGTKTIAAVNVRSGEASFTIPDWSPCGSTAPPGLTPAGGPVMAGAVADPPPPQLHVSGEVQGALTVLADGSIDQAWRMFATVTFPGKPPERNELCGAEGHPCAGGLTIDPKIADAVKAATGPPSYRLDAFIGASLGIDGLGIVGQVSGGRGRLGWFTQVDYVLGDAARSRLSGGGRFTLKK